MLTRIARPDESNNEAFRFSALREKPSLNLRDNDIAILKR
ncbi:hypothetical protein XBP1_2080002 [Xenorhabdus bovienii str. puntauvense]|uniref:Uncharacterized protein n=1 Tax=Xenorhabdus bovienii str. puntauvense TaxID=1398201 RepID=A0A077NBR9_XENBV|nr:hypothetical protein XBP1_2080002 [Xenorhabdus bovienii str. puntauvense]